jgi:2,4-dienoyl-CoA reductase-like NADH-dependent reductase (Old Yellow Enzyme family)
MRGHVDLVGTVRAPVADPYVVHKLEAGEEGARAPCTASTSSIIVLAAQAKALLGRGNGLPNELTDHFVQFADA